MKTLAMWSILWGRPRQKIQSNQHESHNLIRRCPVTVYNADAAALYIHKYVQSISAVDDRYPVILRDS